MRGGVIICIVEEDPEIFQRFCSGAGGLRGERYKLDVLLEPSKGVNLE
jgi:hypothetical protein